MAFEPAQHSFITLEGVDGAGKSTQARLLVRALELAGYQVVSLREPGGTAISEKIRALLLDPANTAMGDTCELLLYEAARAQLVHEVIAPALAAGKVVLCDRFYDSTTCYQAFADGLDRQMVRDANNLAVAGTHPALTLVYHITPEQAALRMAARGAADRMEAKGMAFQERVYQGFCAIAAEEPNRVKLIDATASIEDVFAQTVEQVCAYGLHISQDAVAAALERNYDVTGRGRIVEQMESAAAQLAKEYWADHKRDILYNIDDSYLDGYDEFNTEVQFRNAAKASITYMLMSRCGLEPEAYMEPEDFMPVFDFNTPAAVAALGTAVSEISQQVLRQIEVAIRNYERERSQKNDRIDLHEERRLPDSRPEAERGAGEQAPGQVRDAAEDVPSGASSHPLEPDDPVRDAVPAPAGDRRDGAPEAGTDDAGADAVGGRDGSAESQRPIDVGGADEQLQGTGGRDHSERAGVQLTNDAPEAEPAQPTAAYQMSLFPTEAEQIAYIDTAESANDAPSAISAFISQDDIDHILRTGGNADEARMKIAAEFSKQKPIADRAAFLKNLYYGGNGLITENGRFSAWYGDDGIHIAKGDAAQHLRSAQLIRWTDAAERIDELLDSGTFATNLEVTEAPRYERLSIAVAVWNLYHDFSDEAKSLGYLSCLGNIHSTNFPEETERLTDDLLNPEFREQFLTEYKIFLDAYRENRELLRFHFHRPQALLTRMEDLSLPRKEYHSDMAAVPETGRFITGDEIAASLANGSGFEGGKARIYEFFQTPHTPKESADFLKKEYGIGGRTHAVSRESGSYEDHGSKGITLRKAGCADVQMNWSKVASRISELIRLNRYLTPDEQAAYDKAMEQDALRNAVYNDYNDVKAAYPDEIVLYQVGDFFELYGEDARVVADDLSLELTRRNLEGVGRVTMCGFPANELEKYVEKLREKHDVTISRILMTLENNDLRLDQAQALLSSPTPLADVFKEFENRETDYMDVVRDSMESRANTLLRWWKTPV